MELGTIIAGNLRRIRKQSGVSIGALAEKTGVSKGAISQIEQGNGNPTITTITKLAEALGVGYAALLDAATSEEADVQFADDVPLTVSPDGLFRMYSYYKAGPTPDFEIYIVDLEPGCTRTVKPEKEMGLYIIVNKSNIVVEYGEFSYFLMEGDSITFKANDQFVRKNEGDAVASAFVVAQ